MRTRGPAWHDRFGEPRLRYPDGLGLRPTQVGVLDNILRLGGFSQHPIRQSEQAGPIGLELSQFLGRSRSRLSTPSQSSRMRSIGRGDDPLVMVGTLCRHRSQYGVPSRAADQPSSRECAGACSRGSTAPDRCRLRRRSESFIPTSRRKVTPEVDAVEMVEPATGSSSKSARSWGTDWRATCRRPGQCGAVAMSHLHGHVGEVVTAERRARCPGATSNGSQSVVITGIATRLRSTLASSPALADR
jgi:hypothetical protein